MTVEEAINNLKKLKSYHNGSYGTAIDMAIKALEQQPRPKGKWIEVFIETPEDNYNYGYKSQKCSECGEQPMRFNENFCPNCGADMRGDSE